MTRRIRSIAMITAAATLLVAPALGQAHHKLGHQRAASGHGGGDGCVVNKGFVIKGTLVSYTADSTSTPANEQSVTLTVTKLNRHARRSGLADVDSAAAGTQYRINAGGVAGDPFRVQLSGYEQGVGPAAGDRARVIGKVAVTKRKCEPNASLEDRYDAVDVRKVKIVDRD